MVCEEDDMDVDLIHDDEEQTPAMKELGKVGRLATNAAKNEIMAWAERFDSDTDRLSVAIIASVQVATDAIDAAVALDDRGFAEATLHQAEMTLLPAMEKLRAKLATKQ
jgi:hypothetical protein